MIDKLTGFHVHSVNSRTLRPSAASHEYMCRLVRTSGIGSINHHLQRPYDPVASRCTLKQLAESRSAKNQQPTVGKQLYRCRASYLTRPFTKATEGLKMPAIGSKDADLAGLFIQDKYVPSIVDGNIAHQSKKLRAFLIAPNPELSGRSQQVVTCILPASQRSS